LLIYKITSTANKLKLASINIWIILTLSAMTSFAQKSKQYSNNEPHFIEGIEITRNAAGYSAITVKDEVPTAAVSNPITANITTSSTEEASTLQIKYAQLLDVDIEKTNNKVLYEFIENWLDTRYRFGGSTKSGIDCSGFSSMLCKEVYKITLPRMASEQYKVCEKIDKENMTEGDLVFFNTRGGVSHVGVYLMNDFFIHSSTKEGVIISNLNEDYYHNRFIGAGRYILQEQQKLVKHD